MTTRAPALRAAPSARGPSSGTVLWTWTRSAPSSRTAIATSAGLDPACAASTRPPAAGRRARRAGRCRAAAASTSWPRSRSSSVQLLGGALLASLGAVAVVQHQHPRQARRPSCDPRVPGQHRLGLDVGDVLAARQQPLGRRAGVGRRRPPRRCAATRGGPAPRRPPPTASPRARPPTPSAGTGPIPFPPRGTAPARGRRRGSSAPPARSPRSASPAPAPDGAG